MQNTQARIIDGALQAAERVGFNRMTLEDVATASGVSKQLPLTHFKTMQAIRRKVMREAVRRGNLRILAQGLALRDPHALKAPPELRQQAAASLAPV
jgi:AcrR family transcriptional regulator